MRRYTDEPVPSERHGVTADELVDVPAVQGGATTGTGALGAPERQRGSSQQYHRAPFGTLLDPAPQDTGIGAEVSQAGAGRAFIRPGLTLPEQSTTPEPDRRRIARPMPSAARDQAEVIRSNG